MGSTKASPKQDMGRAALSSLICRKVLRMEHESGIFDATGGPTTRYINPIRIPFKECPEGVLDFGTYLPFELSCRMI